MVSHLQTTIPLFWARCNGNAHDGSDSCLEPLVKDWILWGAWLAADSATTTPLITGQYRFLWHSKVLVKARPGISLLWLHNKRIGNAFDLSKLTRPFSTHYQTTQFQMRMTPSLSRWGRARLQVQSWHLFRLVAINFHSQCRRQRATSNEQTGAASNWSWQDARTTPSIRHSRVPGENFSCIP